MEIARLRGELGRQPSTKPGFNGTEARFDAVKVVEAAECDKSGCLLEVLAVRGLNADGRFRQFDRTGGPQDGGMDAMSECAILQAKAEDTPTGVGVLNKLVMACVAKKNDAVLVSTGGFTKELPKSCRQKRNKVNHVSIKLFDCDGLIDLIEANYDALSHPRNSVIQFFLSQAKTVPTPDQAVLTSRGELELELERKRLVRHKFRMKAAAAAAAAA